MNVTPKTGILWWVSGLTVTRIIKADTFAFLPNASACNASGFTGIAERMDSSRRVD
jgi:hypothetical protein